jgi:hypothetical protein
VTRKYYINEGMKNMANVTCNVWYLSNAIEAYEQLAIIYNGMYVSQYRYEGEEERS